MHIIEHDELTLIRIPAAIFNAQEHELSYNGKLFDVCAYQIKGDTAIITVWHDADEETVQTNIVNAIEMRIMCTDDRHSLAFSKYRPYIPDGKIINKLPRFGFISTSQDAPFVKCPDWQISNDILHDIITPPPDKAA